MIWAQSFNPLTAYVAIAFVALAVSVIGGFAGWVLYCLMMNARRANAAPRPRIAAAIPIRWWGILSNPIPTALVPASHWSTHAANALANTEPER